MALRAPIPAALRQAPRGDQGDLGAARRFLETVRVVCRAELAPGFELAGLRADVAADAGAARARLAALAEDPDVALVLVEQCLHQALPADFVQRLERQAQPLVTSFPSPRLTAPTAADEGVLEILRRAIGYRVRLP